MLMAAAAVTRMAVTAAAAAAVGLLLRLVVVLVWGCVGARRTLVQNSPHSLLDHWLSNRLQVQGRGECRRLGVRWLG